MKNESGFTLIEIMMTSVIMALGTLLLHDSFLKFAELYGRYTDGIRVESWVNDQLWQAREAIVYAPGEAGNVSGSGTVVIGSRSFDWTRQGKLLSGRGFYSIQMNVSWLEGNRPTSTSREIYAFRKQLQ